VPGLDQKNGLKQQFSFDDSHPVPLIDAKHGLLKTKVLVFFSSSSSVSSFHVAF